MDELIGSFIRAHFSEEFVEEVYCSFGVFGLFNHQDGFEAFDGVMHCESSDDGSFIADQFVGILHKQLDYLLEHHTFAFDSDTSIEKKNEILRGLYMLQYLVDYTPIARILESTASDEEQICRILEEVTMYDESYLMSILTSYRQSFLINLKKFVYLRENEKVEQSTPIGNVRNNLRIYHALFGQPEFAAELLDAELLPAQEFKDYLPFLKDDLVDPNSVEETTKRIYWLLLFSSDGTINPLVVFREYSDNIITGIDMISRVEHMLVSFIGRFEELRKVQNEKN